MRSDAYLKAVLTVIAVCLVWICVRDVTLVKPAHAQVSGPLDVNIVGAKRHVFDYAGPLAVKVKNWPSSLE
jgi:hypothetical protein